MSAGAALITMVIAAAVLRTPSERIFGVEIVGRHHDPFTVMQQFAEPARRGTYMQPVTDLTGAAIARVTGPVAAYNWIVLLSFPLSAAAAYLLARHLLLPPPGALLAAALFAFSPFHIAQAAYHPHIAQTQWLPLYFLALWRCLDKASTAAVAFLIAATALVTLSNFYGALIAATITPFATAAYWFARARFAPRAATRLGVTLATLAASALAGLVLVREMAPAVFADRSTVAFVREDLLRYAATWRGYLLPPVVHPLLGALARRTWTALGIDEGLLEQQISLGWSVVVLGLIAFAGWILRERKHGARCAVAAATVPIAAAVAAAAVICSLAPERIILGVTIPGPSALLHPVVPMFRAYARFAVIVQLMAALLAGAGLTWLLDAGTRGSRVLAVVLLLFAVAEYAVWPPALSRDVLPTAAHRWAMRQAGSRILDCDPAAGEFSSVAWLTGGRIEPLDPAFGDCAEPQIAARLQASGFSDVIVRDTWERPLLNARGGAMGLPLRARFADADVFAVQPRALVYTAAMSGFWPREHGDGTTWRWMGADAAWTIVAPASRSSVTLDADLRAFHHARPLTVRLDEGRERTFDIGEDWHTYHIGPLTLTAGIHQLTFHSPAAATPADEVAGNGDHRALSFAIGEWRWSEQ